MSTNEWRLVPADFVSRVLALEHNWTKLVPFPPDYCCDPDAQHWFKEAYRRCGKDLTIAKEMLAAAPAKGAPAPVDAAELETLRAARRLIHGFMLDVNVIGISAAALNLTRGIKAHALVASREKAG